MDKLYENSETGCCPRFDPGPWEGKELNWKNKPFIKDRVLSVFHIPLNIGQVIVKNMELIKNADALPPQPLMFSDENSLFGSDIYILVSKDVPNVKMAKISGKFLSKVFEGDYRNMGAWISGMKDYAKSKGKAVKKMYFFYTTCPNCARYYGRNYVVILAEI